MATALGLGFEFSLARTLLDYLGFLGLLGDLSFICIVWVFLWPLGVSSLAH